MKNIFLLSFLFITLNVFGQSNLGNYPLASAPHDTDRVGLWQGWHSWSPNNHTFGYPLDSLTQYLIRKGFGAGGSPAGSFQDVQVNDGAGHFLGGQGTLYNGILTLPNGSGQALNIGGTSPDAALYINVPFHNSGHYAIDCWQSEYGFSPFKLSPKGTTTIDQREDYGGHPSALSIQAEGSGASSNAALSVTQNGSSGNAVATFMNGNVGIGTTTPQAMLDVDGTANVSTSLSVGTTLSIDSSQSGGFTIYTLKDSLTATQIQTLNSAPVNIGLPSSGVGYYYRVIAFDVNFIYGSIPFTSSTLGIESSFTGGIQWGWGNLNSTGNIFSLGQSEGTNYVCYRGNSILELTSDSDSLTGDSSLYCYITVVKVKL